MTFRFSRQGLQPRERFLERVFEILPGATSWSALLGLTALALWEPLVAAVLIIVFDLYWLLRLFSMTLWLVLSSVRLSIEHDTDWLARVEGLDRLEDHLQALQRSRPRQLSQRLSQWIHIRTLQRLQRADLERPRATAIHHLVIFTIAKEAAAVLEPGLESLARQTFPTNRILVVLAQEARAPQAVGEALERLRRAHRRRFLDVLVAVHPDGLPGEARVKGANATYAANTAAASFQERGVAFEQVIVSCFDADTVVNANYMACLTYAFLACPERTRASFQPIPVYHNNIWEVPGFARVLDIGASFFQLVEATNPETLVTFSSHSMSFKALVDVGYWPVDLISDDSAIFWKAFLRFEGRYRVVPLPVTVSMDVAAASTWWETMRNVYRQKRRWAWGVENFPLVMRGFLASRTIPLRSKVLHAFKLFEGHVAWATWPFLLTVVGWLPALCAGREFSSSVLYYSAPRIAAMIFSLASVSLLTTILLSLCLLPRQTVKRSWWRALLHALEWALVPVVTVFFSAIPALDAQTRLMCGRYMEFWVTEKPRGQRPSLDRGWGQAAIVSAGKTA